MNEEVVPWVMVLVLISVLIMMVSGDVEPTMTHSVTSCHG